MLLHPLKIVVWVMMVSLFERGEVKNEISSLFTKLSASFEATVCGTQSDMPFVLLVMKLAVEILPLKNYQRNQTFISFFLCIFSLFSNEE